MMMPTMTAYRDPVEAPLRKLSVDLIKTYKHINEVKQQNSTFFLFNHREQKSDISVLYKKKTFRSFFSFYIMMYTSKKIEMVGERETQVGRVDDTKQKMIINDDISFGAYSYIFVFFDIINIRIRDGDGRMRRLSAGHLEIH